jgi:hypothetical protein
MEMDTPVETNALDVGAQGVLGKPLDRVDGRLKVTGGAHYAYEVQQGPAVAYGFVVEASIGKGRINSIDTGAAERAPGVVLVLTHRTRRSRARAITMRPIRCSAVLRCRITASRLPLWWLKPSSRPGRPLTSSA